MLPHGARSLLARQLAALAPDTREAAQAAAVLGATFDTTVLATVIDVDRRAALATLDPALSAGLLHDRHDGTLAFAHALVRDAALADLDLATRHSLHLRAAAALEAVVGDPAAAEIAAHYVGRRRPATRRRLVAAGGTRGRTRLRCTPKRANASSTRSTRPTETPIDAAARARRSVVPHRARTNGPASCSATSRARVARPATWRRSPRAALGVGTIGGGFEIRVLDVEQIALLEEALADPGAPSARAAADHGASLRRADARRRPRTSRRARHRRHRDRRAASDDAALVPALAAWCDAHAGPDQIDARGCAPPRRCWPPRRAAATRSSSCSRAGSGSWR